MSLNLAVGKSQSRSSVSSQNICDNSNADDAVYDKYDDDVEISFHNPPHAYHDVNLKETRHKVHTDFLEGDKGLDTIDHYEEVKHVVRFIPKNPYDFWNHPLDGSFHRVSPGTLTLYMGCKWFYCGRIEDLESLKQVFNVIRAMCLAEEYFHESHINRYRCHDCRTWITKKDKIVMTRTGNSPHRPPLSCHLNANQTNSTQIHSLNILHQNISSAVSSENSNSVTSNRPPAYDSINFES